MQISTNLHVKAQRLVDQDRVDHVKGLMYQVQGDTDTYSVHLSYVTLTEEPTGSCDCPSVMAVCSHLLAASIAYLADHDATPITFSTDPFEGLI